MLNEDNINFYMYNDKQMFMWGVPLFHHCKRVYSEKTKYSQILQNFPKLTELSKAKYKIRFCFHFIYRHAIFINRPKITFTRKKREVSFILIETTENQFPVEFF